MGGLAAELAAFKLKKTSNSGPSTNNDGGRSGYYYNILFFSLDKENAWFICTGMQITVISPGRTLISSVSSKTTSTNLCESLVWAL